MMERIELRRAVLNITTRCTLKCKLCVMGAPFFENPPEHDYATVEKTIEKMFSIIDYIQWIEITGGEPFMHKDLPKMIDKVMQYKKQFEKLMIITNGTLLPSEELLNKFVEYKDDFFLDLSHYGEHSYKADELVKLCEDNGVKIRVKIYHGEKQHYGGWVDYGDYHKYHRTEEELIDVFNTCGTSKMKGCFTTHFGQMHWCVPSARGMKYLKVIPDNPEDYIDLFDATMTIERQKKKVISMQEKKYLSACNYCSGNYGSDDLSKRQKAAEQL